MPIFPFFRIFRPKTEAAPAEHATPAPQTYGVKPNPIETHLPDNVRRHFYNTATMQCYASFFHHWNGWITAGHVLTDAAHKWPEFTETGETHIWPEGLDAALKDCDLPKTPPPHPKLGQTVIAKGFPAGSRHLEERHGHVYLERGAGSGTWIMHIRTPDEPVVTGMSGGPVCDAATGTPIGILITRNSPADLNADRDPDESCDFISLRAVWEAVRNVEIVA